MKKLSLSVGLVTLTISMIALVGLAPLSQAAVIFTADPVVSNSGNNWSLKTIDLFTTSPFGGKIDPNSIQAWCWDNANPNVLVYPTIKNLVINNNQINLVFDSSTLPQHVDNVAISGTLQNGDTFLASGPGWTWGNIR